MQMWMMNANDEYKYEFFFKTKHIELVQEWFHLSECKCKLQMRQNESLHVAIGVNRFIHKAIAE